MPVLICSLYSTDLVSDHVRILLTYPPLMLLSGLIVNLKATSCQLMWDNYPNHF
ncbi:MAG: hypothetical protein DWQ58_02825 [Microcystis aeruginosa TA09]|nr:hypothetical protein [Microcystis aeruginosa LG13-13]NCR02529.1 hypothetical protein [Microcystis aeruginosa LG13-03]NCR60728.1 hypothetical protein [Microcystis aeruginosa LG11-05]NCR72213.1 hypothetical protein [Microcystis aeruginosa LG13-12]REJ58540.1 MAG: hypothetical protein DWQ58_02825 [Microcystis aeruginosa TA09]